MSAISRKHLNDLATAASNATSQLNTLSPKSEHLATRLTELTSKLDEFGGSLSNSTFAEASSQTKTRWYASLSVWVSIANLVALAVTLVMIIPAVQSLDTSQKSLVAAEAALQRDELSQTFNSNMSACANVRLDPAATTLLGTTLSTVVTNTGRLPITILDVKSKGDEGVTSVDYFWLPLAAVDERPSDGPIYMEVGKAVAITVFIPGRAFNSALHFTLSNGLEDQEAVYTSPPNSELPEIVSEAYSALPDFCG